VKRNKDKKNENMKRTLYLAALASAVLALVAGCGPAAKGGSAPATRSGNPSGPITETTIAQGSVKGVLADGIDSRGEKNIPLLSKELERDGCNDENQYDTK
jgi:hypothetical protein